ncbi:MAG TPA: hypothetical protein VH595_15695 [Verrucomicrobiae bacterium]|nr:hypothetical protein [Verrucomicrobiae bacterium]
MQSFANGWKDTDKNSHQAFSEFFKNKAKLFPDFTKYFPMVPHPKKPGKKVNAFYLHIRCAILHQALPVSVFSRSPRQSQWEEGFLDFIERQGKCFRNREGAKEAPTTGTCEVS